MRKSGVGSMIRSVRKWRLKTKPASPLTLFYYLFYIEYYFTLHNYLNCWCLGISAEGFCLSMIISMLLSDNYVCCTLLHVGKKGAADALVLTVIGSQIVQCMYTRPNSYQVVRVSAHLMLDLAARRTRSPISGFRVCACHPSSVTEPLAI